jgi:hypothetical protein
MSLINNASDFFSPYEFVVRCVEKFPSLYASPSYGMVKFKVFDHVFNTIGNGLFLEDFTGKKISNDDVLNVIHWFNCEKASYGYEEFEEINFDSGVFKKAIGDSVVVCLFSDKDKHPNIKVWVDFDCCIERNPYPNFTKQYSIVWNSKDFDFSSMGKEWIEEAIWFYEECLKYFLDPERVKSYHYFFPQKNDYQNKDLIDFTRKLIASYEKYPTNEDISNDYGVEFVGDRDNYSDLYNFSIKVWEKEFNRILDFINETILHLKFLQLKA